MAVPRGTRFEIEHEAVFPEGAAIVGPVSPDMEYVSQEDKARGRQPKQKVDEATGLLLWKVTVTDPSAVKDRDKSATVVILDPVQPVAPPAAMEGFDFRPVVFEGLTVEPRVQGEKFKYQGWVLRARAMRQPGVAGGSKSPGSKPGGASAGSDAAQKSAA
ncbi:hypothetical protein FHR81_005445 [Actinoalloteichus hoggarensis]|uniref:Uncharacterized protein n=1 Tax=Actinoalloteichus hoggarensis TaxID=1470176 RepID=A0A221VWM8_9PSEU|nr:hypothetical protein [Actinoalloteichus hoggarensis]ASO17956.1 hypothetical protein AHOG_01455 [Actinoalloteichus hoggarensis]MBB5924368.1 hypothetical protein [Actinoalloteichus hoggarensis]